jgi:hypothetical protein
MALSFLLLFPAIAAAESRQPTLVEGDQIAITLSGDLAREYAKAIGDGPAAAEGLRIETMATLEQRLADGRIRIEHSSQINQAGKAPRLVTLSATIARSSVVTEVSPKGTKVYASPNSKDAVITTKESAMHRATLSDLKGLKLRTWTLSSEIGK